MSQEGEFSVVISQVQMAAILERESLSATEIATNRIFGGLRIVGGIIELGGAGVLCAIPEPTMITKVGCAAMGIHAADQLAAGSAQLLTGLTVDSYAYKSGQAMANGLGASAQVGQGMGLAMEFAVPLSVANLYNAFRVSSIRAGRMTLNVSERPLHAPKSLGGGHAYSVHVDKPLEFLQKRALKMPGAESISTFGNAEKAEWAVSQVLQRNKLKVIFMSKVKMRSSVYTLEADLGQIVGWGIRPRSPATVIEMTKVRVVIKYAEFNNMPMYILTALPIL